jgi:hypothetical protein
LGQANAPHFHVADDGPTAIAAAFERIGFPVIDRPVRR